MTEPKRRGRPPKVRPVEIVQAETETPATIERPEPDPSLSQNPITLVAADEVVAPEVASIRPSEIEAAKSTIIIDETVSVQRPEPVDPVTHEPFRKRGELTPAQVRALDRDYDGEAGGSRPVASLTDLQRQAYVQDAVSAYEGQEQYKRTDSFNRVWEFRHDVVKNHDMMLIGVRRGPQEASRHIPASHFNADQADGAIRDLDAETAR